MSRKKTWHKSKSFSESFEHAGRGMLVAISRDKNIRRQFGLGCLALVLAIYLKLPVVQVEIIIVCVALVLGLETVNSALEAAADILHPNYHAVIGTVKDISAGAVLVVSLASLLIALLIFIPPMLLLVAGW